MAFCGEFAVEEVVGMSLDKTKGGIIKCSL